jgi:hypothetical protein
MIDLVVDRREMKATVAGALRFMGARAAAPIAAAAVAAAAVPEPAARA